MRACAWLGLSYAVLAVGAMLLFAPQCAMLFLNRMRPILPGLCPSPASISLPSPLSSSPGPGQYRALLHPGMGFSQLAILAGVLEMAARTVMGQVFVPLFGFTAACFASPVAWISADLFLIPRRHPLHPPSAEAVSRSDRGGRPPPRPRGRTVTPLTQRPRRKSAWAFPFVKKVRPYGCFRNADHLGSDGEASKGKETRAVKRSAWVSTWN